MWGYQSPFRAFADGAAKRTFHACDQHLAPQVFLVGVRIEPTDSRAALCIEPADNTLLQGACLLPSSLEGIDGASHAAMDAEELAETIRTRLDALTQAGDVVHFCAPAVVVEGYRVVIVLRLTRSVFSSFYSLSRVERDGLRFRTSFLDALVDVFLEDQEAKLDRKQPGASWGRPHRPADELLRAAGQLFAMTVGFAGGDIEAGHKLFDACTTIAALSYEGSESRGSVLLCRKGHPNVSTQVAFKNPILVSQHRAVRKLIEATSQRMSLISDGVHLLGLGVPEGTYDGAAEDLFEIRFAKHHCWELYHLDNIMMRVVAGHPSLPRPSSTRPQLKDAIERIFIGIDSVDIERACDLVEFAVELSRGCTLVFVADAQEEAFRLGGQAVEISPLRASNDFVSLASTIDGAILLDSKCMCYAFGVILDGHASDRGDRSRGSRYNSAVRYQQSSKQPCVVVVVSEDGMVDVVPVLRPRISRGLVESHVVAIERWSADAPRAFFQSMQWLASHRFYLSPEQCARVNAAKAASEAAPHAGTRQVFSNFTPDADMNDTYLLP